MPSGYPRRSAEVTFQARPVLAEPKRPFTLTGIPPKRVVQPSPATAHKPAAPALPYPVPVIDIAYHVQHGGNGRLLLSKVLHIVAAATKMAIFKSGKGLEGYIRSFPTMLTIDGIGQDKAIVVVLPELIEYVKTMQQPIAKDNVTVATKSDPTVLPQQPAAAATPAQPAAPAPAVPAPVLGFVSTAPLTPQSAPKPAAVETPLPTAVEEETATKESAPVAPADAQQPLVASQPATVESITVADAENVSDPDRADPNYALRKRINELLPDSEKYYALNDVFNIVYRGVPDVKYSDMVAYIRSAEKYFWFAKSAIAKRLPGQTEAPAFVIAPLKPNKSVSNTVPAAAASNGPAATDAFGGWGSAANIPTAEDIYEILKYIPVHWVEVGHLTIPKQVRKTHVRISSIIVFFERQPKYFELRFIAGTLEVRRAVVLHPEAHQLTKEQAEEYLAAKIAENAKKPNINAQIQDWTANRERLKLESIAQMSQQQATATPSVNLSAMSPALEAVVKLIVRVCPGYPIGIAQILRRPSAKKNTTTDDIVTCLPLIENQIERIDVVAENGQRALLLRKKTGVDATTWRAAFLEDIQKCTDLKMLVTLMTLSCCQWDRVHFLYVRLTDDEKRMVNGFDGMVALMKAHPAVFRIGEFFYKRCNPSDPASDVDPEPTSNHQSSTVVLEENPYHNSRDLALVFHYLTPEDQSASLSHFVESCSPAMRAVLPPRIVTVIQAHPELFMCKEIAPGQYSVSRALTAEVSVAGGEDFTKLSKEDVVKRVLKFVPNRGIDIGHLTNALPLGLKTAVTKHFGSIQQLISAQPGFFHVVQSPPYQTIFVKN